MARRGAIARICTWGRSERESICAGVPAAALLCTGTVCCRRRYERRAIFALIMLSWVVAGLVLMSYATALMFDAYIQAHRSVVSARRTAERVALFASYAAAASLRRPLAPSRARARGGPTPPTSAARPMRVLPQRPSLRAVTAADAHVRANSV